jgi:hypothetical protein
VYDAQMTCHFFQFIRLCSQFKVVYLSYIVPEDEVDEAIPRLCDNPARIINNMENHPDRFRWEDIFQVKSCVGLKVNFIYIDLMGTG